MKCVSFVTLLLWFTACSTISKPERDIANESVFNMDEYISSVEKLLKLVQNETQTPLVLINYPLMRPEDVGPSNPLELLDTISRRYNIDDEEYIYENYGEHLPDFASIEQMIKSRLITQFSYAERTKLLSLCFLGPTHVGAPVWVAEVLAQGLCEYPQYLHSEDEVIDALKQFPQIPKNVKYNGNIGFHEYSDKTLESLVQIITVQLNDNKDAFYKLFHKQSLSVKTKFQQATDDNSEASKIEPFDLLGTYSVKYIIGSFYGQNADLNIPIDKIQLSKMVQKSLAWVFHLTQKEHAHLTSIPSLTMLKGESNFAVLCTKGMMPNQTFKQIGQTYWHRGSFGSDLVESWVPSVDLRELTKKKKGSFSFNCNTIDYYFSYKSLESTPLPEPQDFSFQKGQDIHALMTISLVHEINRTSVNIAKMVTTLFSGWKVTEDLKSVDSEKYIKAKLSKADAYFPVMHSMDINYFNMGTRQGLAITLKKQIADSQGKRNVYLSILFPDGTQQFETLMYKSEDLSRILNERYKVKNTPLFLMNNSCNSDITLLSWVMVYRKALEARNSSQPMNDFPHIIGSRRAFGTSNIIEIFSHSKYPMHSLEMLAQGRSIEEILVFLKSPAPKTALNRVARLFSDKQMAEESNGFDPVYVMEYPELLTSKGIEFRMRSRAIKGENSY